MTTPGYLPFAWCCFVYHMLPVGNRLLVDCDCFLLVGLLPQTEVSQPVVWLQLVLLAFWQHVELAGQI